MELRNLIPWHRDRETIAVRRDAEPFITLQDRLNRMFEDFFRGTGISSFGASSGSTAVPSVDVSETAEEIRIDAELPGVEEKDIQISLDEGMLVLSGEKQSEVKTEEKEFHHVERSWGSFRRAVRLPCEVVGEKATATFKNGVLSVRLPKKESARPNVHKIQVQPGE